MFEGKKEQMGRMGKLISVILAHGAYNSKQGVAIGQSPCTILSDSFPEWEWRMITKPSETDQECGSGYQIYSKQQFSALFMNYFRNIPVSSSNRSRCSSIHTISPSLRREKKSKCVLIRNAWYVGDIKKWELTGFEFASLLRQITSFIGHSEQ